MIKTIFVTLTLLTVADLTLTATALRMPCVTERNPLYPQVDLVGLAVLNFAALALILGLSKLYLRISEGYGRRVFYSTLAFCVVSRGVVVGLDLWNLAVFFIIIIFQY